MSEPKFTPGPWLVMANQIGTQETEIASICLTAQIRLPKDETKANAHLIAAAPDLYEALEYCIKQIPEFGDVPGIKAALAKARGENHA